MKLASPHRAPERILLYGHEGAGKTWCWFDTAKHTIGNLYVIDTDQTTLPYLESPEFADLESRITYTEPTEFPHYRGFVRKHAPNAQPNDILVVDMVGVTWEDAQKHFSDVVYGKELGDFWMAYVKQLKANDGKGSQSPFDANTDWQAIKKPYRQLIIDIVRAPWHVFFVAGEKQINTRFDATEMQRLYGQKGGGMKPDCEKTLGHAARTILRVHGQRMTTVKDRMRREIQGEKITSFALQYLRGVAGWEIVSESVAVEGSINAT